MKHHFPLSFSAILTTFVFMLMLLKIFKKSKTNDQNLIQKLPPGPWKLPVIGNMHQMAGFLPHRRLRDLAKKYGDIMHLQLGEVPSIVITSAEAAKEVLKAHDIIFAQRPFSLAVDVIYYNSTNLVFAPYGDYWRQLRKICILELLSLKRVQSFRSIREDKVSDFIKSISARAGSVINFSSLLFSLAYSFTSTVAFGKICKGQNMFISTAKEIVKVAEGFSIADLFPSIKLIQWISRMRPQMEKLHQAADKILEEVICEHKAKSAMSRTGGENEAQDLVDVLLSLQDHGELEFPLTVNNIKAVILDMFIAGSDTSSTVIEWAMSEMMNNPRVMEKAQSEVRQVFSSKGNVDEAGLQELTYLKLVIKETLRLHPPIPLLVPRECRESCEISGYNRPAKSKVIINAWAIQRDPKYWNDAENFYPERFLDGMVDYKGFNFEFIPFGAGRRMCPGIAFGMANVELPLAQLLYHFDWKLPNNLKAEYLDMSEDYGSVVRRKNDLYLIPMPHQPFAC